MRRANVCCAHAQGRQEKEAKMMWQDADKKYDEIHRRLGVMEEELRYCRGSWQNNFFHGTKILKLDPVFRRKMANNLTFLLNFLTMGVNNSMYITEGPKKIRIS